MITPPPYDVLFGCFLSKDLTIEYKIQTERLKKREKWPKRVIEGFSETWCEACNDGRETKRGISGVQLQAQSDDSKHLFDQVHLWVTTPPVPQQFDLKQQLQTGSVRDDVNLQPADDLITLTWWHRCDTLRN